MPFALGAVSESITYTPDGGKSTTYTVPAGTTTFPYTGNYTLTLSDKLALTSITVKWAGGAVPGAIVPGTGLNPQWSILRVEAVSGDPNARKIVLINNTIDSAQTKSLMPGLDEGELAICLYSKAAVQALVTMAGKTIGAEGAPEDVAAAQDLLDELTAIKDDNELNNTDVLGSGLAADLGANIDSLQDQVDEAGAVETVTVSAGENYTVTPATLNKNAEETTESTVVIKVADGKSASLPTTKDQISVTAGGVTVKSIDTATANQVSVVLLGAVSENITLSITVVDEPETVTVSAGENYTVTPATLNKNAEETTESTVVIKVADGKSASLPTTKDQISVTAGGVTVKSIDTNTADQVSVVLLGAISADITLEINTGN